MHISNSLKKLRSVWYIWRSSEEQELNVDKIQVTCQAAWGQCFKYRTQKRDDKHSHESSARTRFWKGSLAFAEMCILQDTSGVNAYLPYVWHGVQLVPGFLCHIFWVIHGSRTGPANRGKSLDHLRAVVDVLACHVCVLKQISLIGLSTCFDELKCYLVQLFKLVYPLPILLWCVHETLECLPQFW